MLDIARNIGTTQIIAKIKSWMNNNTVNDDIITDDFIINSTSGSRPYNVMITLTCENSMQNTPYNVSPTNFLHHLSY